MNLKAPLVVVKLWQVGYSEVSGSGADDRYEYCVLLLIGIDRESQ